MRKVLSLIIMSSLLAACGGEPTESSSSSSALPTSSASSISTSSSVASSSSLASSSKSSALSSSKSSSSKASSSAVSSSSVSSSSASSVASSSAASSAGGNVANGETLYGQQCAFCHNHNGDGTFGSSTATKFDINNLKKTSLANLATYIAATMPYTDPKACVGSCAEDTAAYLKSFARVASSSSASSVVSSSSRSAVSSSSSSKSSSSSVVSSASSSAASSSSAVSLYSNFTTDINAGRIKYNDATLGCVACHGVDGSGPVSQIKINTFESEQQLFTLISDTMPKTSAGPGACVGQCAADITAYLMTWKTVTASCDAEAPVIYSPRTLRILTAQEYENTLEDLGLVSAAENFAQNVPSDVTLTKSRFSNNALLSVSELYANKYYDNAKNIAAKAATTVAAGCTTQTACVDRFMALAYKMFRRPLTATERTQYTQFFTDNGLTDGMRLALTAALNSPQFLYRSEMGIPVAEALANGWDTGTTGSSTGGTTTDGYTAGAGGTTVNGVSFATKTTGGSNMDGTWNLWTNGSMSHTFNFTEPTLIVINAKGNDYDMTWPAMTVTAGSKTIAMVMVEHYELREYKFLVTGVTGNQQLTIAFTGDQGREPYGTPGNDKNLYIGDVTVAPAVTSGGTTAPVSNLSSLELADADAYVLDPYEYATVLAYMFTGSTPDDLLLKAAAEGKLNAPADVEAQVNRLVLTARGREHIGRFAGTWLRTDDVLHKTRTGITAFTDQVKQDMAEEVRELFRYVFFNDTVPFEAFYGGDMTMLNRNLASFYGVSNFSANGWAPVNVPNRGGVLTTGAFMTANAHDDRSSPIQRAVDVRELVLCHHIDPPPVLAAERDHLLQQVMELENQGVLTSREYYEIVTDHTACDGCHQSIINPLFGMEDFDQVGRFRTTMKGLGPNGQTGLDIDNSGLLIGTASAKGTDQIAFNGTKELGQVVSQLPAAQACFIRNSFRYLTGLPIDQDSIFIVNGQLNEPDLTQEQVEDYACVKEQLQQVYSANNSSPKAVFSKLGTLDLIRFRK